jgi:hypothetical protein
MNKIYLQAGDTFVVTTEVTLVHNVDEDNQIQTPPNTVISWGSAADLAGYQNPYDIHDPKVGEFTRWDGNEATICNVYRDVTNECFYYNESGE